MFPVRIPVGRENFDEIRKNRSYYIDKTEILYELVEGTDNEVTLFTRPRRFGKTLMLSMMESFFSIQKGDSSDVFKGLSVMKHEEFCAGWMNRYPVLFMTFKGVEALSFEEAYKILLVKLADLCKKHSELMTSQKVNADDKKVFQCLVERKADLAEVKSSLKTIMRMMAAQYGKPVILLIDEYDVPLSIANEKNTAENRYYEKMLDLIRGIFDAALKTNEYLKFAVITGCLRIAKESIFTGTNNFMSYSVLDEDFSGYFGFTREDVDRLLGAIGRQDKMDMVRTWYDGYVFGNTQVYCPWDVASYAAALLKREDALPKNYWKNTSHNGILLTFVKRTDFDVTDKFEVLLNGGTILQVISDELTYDSLHASEENLWSVLLMTGYLTKADPTEVGNSVHLKIPNEEIGTIFEETVVTFFRDTLDRSLQKALMDALWNGDEQKASDLMTKILFATISYHDYHEDYYHAFLTGIISGLGYAVRSNQENGLGRSDIDVREKKKHRAMILEAKKSDSEAHMKRDCEAGKQQILDNDYIKGFEGFDEVLCYGIAFYRKRALVRRLTL
ncbi:MAG: AAA family ATPase [Lachnospiraceae bacterium]|nr:AAA family ATPase [Lachnospiraceae bacterium]